jgi:hypothetical protein
MIEITLIFPDFDFDFQPSHTAQEERFTSDHSYTEVDQELVCSPLTSTLS